MIFLIPKQDKRHTLWSWHPDRVPSFILLNVTSLPRLRHRRRNFLRYFVCPRSRLPDELAALHVANKNRHSGCDLAQSENQMLS